jgi:hypothetical protein
VNISNISIFGRTEVNHMKHSQGSRYYDIDQKRITSLCDDMA